jgi:hypothetical protein
MARRRMGIGGGAAPGIGSGGTAFNPAQRVPTRPSPKPTTPTEIAPPFLSYDPSIEAQRRAAQRGLEDTEANVATKEHFAQTDLAHALAKLKTSTVRSRQDINRTASRGLQTLGNQEQNELTTGARAQADFNTSLANIARSFGQLGHRQAESANAAGTLDAGTQAASAAARAGNQRLAEAPINTARGREEEDLATALQRIGTSRGQVTEDQGRSLTRTAQDREREAKAAKRGTGRTDFEAGREQERARREAQITNIDLLAQEIYAARAEHPAVFASWKKQNPEAIARAEGKARANKETGGNVQTGIGGGAAVGHKRRGGR